MKINIIQGDITKIKVDAIVNAANSSLLGGGGVDGAIHMAAGGQLLNECRLLGGCKTGEAKITKGYNLLANFVIHTVGPIWQGGNCGEENYLASCYKNATNLALENQLRSIAFPLISSGAYGYPIKQAIKVAVETLNAYADKIDISLVLFDCDTYELAQKINKGYEKRGQEAKVLQIKTEEDVKARNMQLVEEVVIATFGGPSDLQFNIDCYSRLLRYYALATGSNRKVGSDIDQRAVAQTSAECGYSGVNLRKLIYKAMEMRLFEYAELWHK